jgi:hypothetical protein
MEELLNSLVLLLTNNGLPAGVGLAIGILFPYVLPHLKAFVGRTPTKADDLIVDTLEAITKRRGPLSTMTATELEKTLPTAVIVELVKLRKARIEAAKNK